MKKTDSGFTLLELLVVIAIIAILVGFISANFLGARQRAKDVKIKATFDQMKKALRLYYNDYNNYPGPATTAINTFNGCGAGTPPNGDCASTLAVCDGAFAVGAACDTVYMKLLPPADDIAWSYQQRDGANGTPADDFCLWATLENQGDKDIALSHQKCASVCPVGLVPATDYVVCSD